MRKLATMKLNAALAKSLLMAASIGTVVPLIAQTSPKKDASKQPAKPDTAKPAAAAEEEIKIPGTVLTRPGGGFLSLTLEGGNYRIAFYDAQKKPTSVDVARGSARWNSVNKTGDERAVLNPTEDGKALIGNRFVRPPYVFKLFLTLLGPDDAVVESHVVDFRG
jgi:hypothetical protein